MGVLQTVQNYFLRRAISRNADAAAAFSILSKFLGGSVGSMSVTPYSMLGVAAIFAAIRIRGETLSNLPLRIVERRGRAKVLSEDLQLAELLQSSPDGQISAVEWVHTMESHSCLMGISYTYIERDVYGAPLRLIQVPASEVSYWLDEYGQPSQHLEYNVRGKRTPASDLIIIPFGSVYPYWQNFRPQQLLNTPIALAQALDREAYSLLNNGCSVSGVLQTDQQLNEDAQVQTKEMLRAYRAGGKEQGAFLILQNGLKYVAARMTNKDAEFVELKKRAVLDIAAIYGVPSSQLGDGEKANYSSQEEANRNFLYSTMLSRARLFENELTNKLIPTYDRIKYGKRIEFDYKGLMRGNMKDRSTFYKELFYLGVLSPNDIREMEDMPLLGEEGDAHFIQANMLELGKVVNSTEQKTE